MAQEYFLLAVVGCSFSSKVKLDTETKLKKESELITGKKSFLGCKIYPGGRVEGLIVFKPLTNETAEVKIIILGIKLGKNKYTAEFN